MLGCAPAQRLLDFSTDSRPVDNAIIQINKREGLIGSPRAFSDYVVKVNKDRFFQTCSCVSFNSKDLPKRNSDFLTIVGGSDNVKNDVKKWGIHGDIVTVNFSGLFLNRDYDHLASFHCDLFKHLINLRKLAITKKKFYTHSRITENRDFVNYIWSFVPKPKSSGLLALWIGIALGYKKILLHGIPLDNSGRFTDIENDETRNLYYEECSKNIDFSKFINVRSSSGNSLKIFGEPTWNWIQKT